MEYMNEVEPWFSDHFFPLTPTQDEAYRGEIIKAIKFQSFHTFEHAFYYAWQTDRSLIPSEMRDLFMAIYELLLREREEYDGGYREEGYIGDVKSDSVAQLYHLGYRAVVDRMGYLSFAGINPSPSA